MAAVSSQRQAVVLACLLAVTVIAVDKSDKNPESAVGPSLAQGAMKILGPTVLSELSDFASLDDNFDESDILEVFDDKAKDTQSANDPPRADGPSLAQSAVRFHGKSLLSEVTGDAMDQFASLDDIFDENAKDVEVEAEPAEPWDFSLKDVLWSPTLYFTIALLIGAGLFLTAPSDKPDITPPEHGRAVGRAVADDSQSPKIDTTKQGVDAKTEATPVQGADSTVVEKPESRLLKEAEKTQVPPLKLHAEQSQDDSPNALLAARDATRAGEAGSYANFCKLLAAQNNVQ